MEMLGKSRLANGGPGECRGSGDKALQILHHPSLMEVDEGETGQVRNGVIFKYKNFQTTISIKRSCRELSINMVIHRFVFKNTRNTLSTCFTLMPETGMEQP